MTVIERGRKVVPSERVRNWSGYVATGETFGIVNGDWTVPAISCAPGANTVAAQWVGIDGYEDATVEQDGIAMNCVHGAPSYYAWYEMVGDPAVGNGLPVVLSYPVSAGDSISAGVSAPDPSAGFPDWLMTVWDYTAGWYSQTPVPGPTSVPAQSSAEWVVEDPIGPTATLLSDFGTATFAKASASSAQNEIGGGISVFPFTVLKMTNPATGSLLAAPSRLTAVDGSANSSFSVAWRAAS